MVIEIPFHKTCGISESEDAMVDVKVSMTKRRMEEIALILLTIAVNHHSEGTDDIELPNELTVDELLEFMTILAPEIMAEMMEEIDTECNPLEHLDEILHGVSERMKAGNALPKRNSTCPSCESGKLEFPVEDGIYVLSGNLACPNCGTEFSTR